VQIGKKQNVAAEAARQVLQINCPQWHNRPIGTLRREEIEALLELVRDGDAKLSLKPRPYLSNLLYARLKPLFGWAVKTNKLKLSPMLSIDKPFANEQRRERSWFKGEGGNAAIRSIWAAADKIGGVEGQYIKLLLLSGKRKVALSQMRWEEIEPQPAGWFWHAPES
jgi:hypothetical protein